MQTSISEQNESGNFEMMEHSGYAGDEEDRETTTSAEDDEFLFPRGKVKSSPFFHVAPRKRRRQRTHDPSNDYDRFNIHHTLDALQQDQPIVPYKTSLVLLSKLLTQHMSQTTLIGQQPLPTTEAPWRPSDGPENSFPSIMSSQHLFLEDAMSFSSLPRILLEADRPNRIVHANAAYARRHGKHKVFQFSGDNLELAVMDLFPYSQADEVTMYPVWGSDCEADGSLQHVTHYLAQEVVTHQAHQTVG